MKNSSYWILFQILIVIAIVSLLYSTDGREERMLQLLTFIASVYVATYTNYFFHLFRESSTFKKRVSTILRISLPILYICCYLFTIIVRFTK